MENNDLQWQQSIERFKNERNINFTAITRIEDFDCEKKKASRDPMSHRVIEKRRRDRMNSCLAELSRLVPSACAKKGRGRVEKTEIIEMAIKHMKHLQAHSCKQFEKCEATRDYSSEMDRARVIGDQYRLGYQECLSEAVHFLVEIEGFFPGDSFCVRLMDHLQSHCDQIFASRQELNATTETTNYIKADADIMVRDEDDDGRSSSKEEMTETSKGDCDLMLLLVDHDKDPCAESLPNNSHQPTFNNDCMHANEGGSQLRQMLETPTAHLVHHRLKTDSPSTPLSPSSLAAHCAQGPNSHLNYLPMNTDTCSTSSKGEEVYKFKTNIKDRFHADLQQAKCPEDLTDRNHDVLTDAKNGHTDWFQLMDRSHHQMVGPSEEKFPATDPLEVGTVPAFALHPKGTFYVPLTLSVSQVLPYFNEVDGSSSKNVLHQVGIAVCFCRAAKQDDRELQRILEHSKYSKWQIT